MPSKNPRFWLEILILGLMLVSGMATLHAWLPQGWGFIARVVYAAALFGTYAIHYERKWRDDTR